MLAITELKKISAELTDLYNIMALLQWDQETQIPDRASEGRASQFGTLSTLIHRKEVSRELGELISTAEEQSGKFSEIDKALVRVLRRNYDQNTKLPEEFVADFAILTSQALQIWVKARQENDFNLFEPYLEKIVEMSLQKGGYLGYANEPYDALLDLHEEGLTATEVERMFADLRDPLMDMVDKASNIEQPDLSFHIPFKQEDQERFGEKILKEIGFDFTRGYRGRSAHPFTTSLGHHDRRITNRYKPDSCEYIFSALHEGGHALYEQGIDESLARSHLDTGISLGIHESQSRLWENIIGRSLPFWEKYFPELQTIFPDQFQDMSAENFFRFINAVRPGFIRVEADEVSYNLHVLIRFELERALISGAIKVHDLPAIWNEKYKEYLGVSVESDANGVLQDVHWAHGSLGYFPTYTIGNLAAAQIWQVYKQFDPVYEDTLRAGDLKKIRQWLTEKIYRHGSVYPPKELLKMVTGEELNSSHFITYLNNKYSWS